jgi:phosphomannomutase
VTLIKSISGIRGTIGGKPGDNLTPLDVTKFTAAYGTMLLRSGKIKKVVVGRDARISGSMISSIVVNTLIGLGIDVVDLGLSTTPTVEIAVPMEQAGGGIILTASHNPAQWNALKLLNEKGEFISSDEGQTLLKIAENEDFDFSDVFNLGKVTQDESYIDKHIDKILQIPYVDIEAIKKANIKVAIDCVNSTGGIALPKLLTKMGVKFEALYCEPNGHFPHNPEPLPEHLTELSNIVLEKNCDMGITVDPDVDRLAFVNEDGTMFGEEYTIVAVVDFILQHTKTSTVSNLSSSRALRDVTERAGCLYQPSAVGEVNVVNKMKEIGAKIGGEGNGGVIYPELHYGRDSLVGIAFFLTHFAQKGISMTALKASYPHYEISKNKIELTPDINVDKVLVEVEKAYSQYDVNTIDGVKVNFEKE